MRRAARSSSSRSAITMLAVFALMIGWADDRLSRAMTWRFPPLTELVVTENYLTDIGCLLIGAHRLAADVAYVQFLQYYGLSEHVDEDEEDKKYEGELIPGSRTTPEAYMGHLRAHDISRGHYQRILELSQRMMRLDPFFNSVVLEAAGALAFNQKRIDESLQLLREAIERDPSYYRYHLYLSSILYKEKGNDAGMIDFLLEAIKYPDCPPMFQMILGNLLKKVGRPLDAAHVFIHAYQTAHKEYEKADALRRLKLVCAQNPEVARQVAGELPAN